MMKNVLQLAKDRKSVRTYSGGITVQDREALSDVIGKIENPYGIDFEFAFLDAQKQNLSCPVVTGTADFIGAKAKHQPYVDEAFGYSFERLVLYAQSLGIGTVYIGGTMDRKAFERAMQVAEDEVMPCVSPLGYPAKKLSLRDAMMRKGIRADSRENFESLFFDGDLDTPLTEDRAGMLLDALQAVRLAPSAVNRQPWRVVVQDQAVHFYLKRTRGFAAGRLDMQKIDMGIALCHFALTLEEAGVHANFLLCDPKLSRAEGLEYIASYRLD